MSRSDVINFLIDPLEFRKGKWVHREVEHADWFAFREDRNHHWLQKLALWVLRKLDCKAKEQVKHQEDHRYVRIDRDDLFEEISRHLIGVKELCSSGEELTLIVGTETMQELVGTTLPNTVAWSCLSEYMLSTPVFDPHYAPGDPVQPKRVDRKLMGMPVVVVPWVDGFAAVPTKLLHKEYQK